MTVRPVPRGGAAASGGGCRSGRTGGRVEGLTGVASDAGAIGVGTAGCASDMAPVKSGRTAAIIEH